MSRPTKAESDELEALERANGKIAGARDTAGIVAVRFRSALRRVPWLDEILRPGQEQVTAIVDALDEAHELVGEVLAERRRERQERDPGTGR